MRDHRPLFPLALLGLMAPLLAHGEEGAPHEPPGPLQGLYVRAGVFTLQPVAQSGPVVLSNVEGTARLATQDGPIAGSAVGLSPVTEGVITVGYRFWNQFSVETLLALPLTLQLTAKGTLATQSLAPYALGNLPTGVPALGPRLGEVKVLPPVLTVTYRFLPGFLLQPYLGAGATYLYSYDGRITNPVLTEVKAPQLTVPGSLGYVGQAGFDLHIWRGLTLTGDVKYLGGIRILATLKDVEVAVPALPLYGTARVGDASVAMNVSAWVFQGGIGWNF